MRLDVSARSYFIYSGGYTNTNVEMNLNLGTMYQTQNMNVNEAWWNIPNMAERIHKPRTENRTRQRNEEYRES